MKKNKSALPEALAHICGSIFFLGIGGSGMYGVARLARALGFSVCGTDAKESKNTERLQAEGIPLFREGEPLPKDTSLVVYSYAVPSDHKTLVEARRNGVPCYDRAAFFGLLMLAFPIRASVAGSHGKSSTTAMCASILSKAGLSPTVVSGADLGRTEGSFREGEGDILLFEACEYKDAFLSFCPTHALALGASWEHTDYFPDMAAVRHSFSEYLSGKSVRVSVAPYGFLPADVTYGEGGDISAHEICTDRAGSRFLLTRHGKAVGRVALSVLGAYQVENALGAAALAYSLGVSDDAVLAGLAAYQGVPRRMEKKGVLRGASLYLDFAHHPKELLATLRTAESLGKPLAVVFEPHTYSRTYTFFEEYVRILRMPHIVGVLPVYAAREKDTGVVSSKALAQASGAAYLSDYPHAARFLIRAAGKGCTLLLIGAGGVEGVLPYLSPLLWGM